MAFYIEIEDELFGIDMPRGEDAALAMYGAQQNIYNVLYFTLKDVENGKIKPWVLSKNTFVGVVDTMKVVFEKLGKTPPIISFPESRTDFKFGTLGEVKKIFTETKVPVFVKSKGIKVFDGQVIRDEIDFNFMSRFNDDIEVGYSPVYNIKAEYRIYIYNHEIVGICNYSGSLFEELGSDIILVKKQIEVNKSSFPCAYTMDIGLTDKENIIIEYNDFWSIGNYGISPELYARMLKDRYFEIVNG